MIAVAALTVASASTALTSAIVVVAAVAGLILLAGLLAGQFRRGVVQELRDSLATANNEISIERGRSDRLVAELKETRDAVSSLERRLLTFETENRVLRETLQSGIKLAPEFHTTMLDLLRAHEEKSADLVAAATERAAAAAKATAEQVAAEARTAITANNLVLLEAIERMLEEHR